MGGRSGLSLRWASLVLNAAVPVNAPACCRQRGLGSLRAHGAQLVDAALAIALAMPALKPAGPASEVHGNGGGVIDLGRFMEISVRPRVSQSNRGSDD